jgi:serine protease AprX
MQIYEKYRNYILRIIGCIAQFSVTRSGILNLKQAGIFVAVAAGNSGPECNTISSPAAIFNESFTVGATRSNDTIANFSSRGAVFHNEEWLLKPDVSAPGQSVRSVVINGDFRNFSGTSMAAPHIAGGVALLISANPDLRGQVYLIEDALRSSALAKTSDQDCEDLPGAEVPNATYGHGRIDLVAAYEMLKSFSHTIEETESLDMIKLFPNPTADMAYLEINSGEEIKNVTVFSSAGKLVSQFKNIRLSHHQLDLSQIQKGIYFVQIQTSSKIFTKKLIKL